MATQAVAANQRKWRVIAPDAEEEQRSGNNFCLFGIFQSPLSAVISIVFLFSVVTVLIPPAAAVPDRM